MTAVLVQWTAQDLGDHVDEVLDVYAGAMGVARPAARGRRGILTSHLERQGLRAVAALEGEQLVGVGYGYVGEPGQWWHDQVKAAMDPSLGSIWLTDAFEVCELHVLPRLHGTGIGRGLLEALLADCPARTAVLTTPDVETRARRFYRLGGWVDLVRDLQFPGDPRRFAVLGLLLEASRS